MSSLPRDAFGNPTGPALGPIAPEPVKSVLPTAAPATDWGLGDSIQKATGVRPPNPMGIPPGLARKGVTNWQPGMGNPFGRGGAQPTAPVAPAVPTLPQQAQPQVPTLPQQAQGSPFTKPMFSFLFGGQ